MKGSVTHATSLAFGIYLASLLPTSVHPLLYLSAAVVCGFQLRGSLRTLSMMALLGALLMTMSLRSQEQVARANAALLDDRQAELLVGTVIGPTEQLPGRQRVLLQTDSERVLLTIYGQENSAGQLLLPGQRIEAAVRLRRPIGLRGVGTANRRFQVMARGASLVGSARRTDVQVVSEEFSVWAPAMKLHHRAMTQIEKRGGDVDGRGIIAALATGERRLMSESLMSAVRASGLAHLLAVSGMHLAAVVALLYFVVIRLWCLTRLRQVLEPKAVAAGVALMGAIFFTALTGAHASTCRALVVAALVLLGVMLNRRIRLLPALALAAIALLLHRPVLLWDVGFQMSFAATLALALVFSHESGALTLEQPSKTRSLLRGGWSLARASFWASFATAPIAIYHFGALSGLALLSNLLAVPLVTLVLLPASFLGILLGLLWAPLGSLVLTPCITIAGWLANLCYGLETLVPLQSQPPFGAFEFFLWAATGALLLTWRTPSPTAWLVSRRSRSVVLVVLVSVFVLLRMEEGAAPEVVRITFVEIGQGDAAVIELPDGQVWLVDGGGLPFVAPTAHGDPQRLAESPARKALLPYLRHRRIRHIDLAIVSHPHPDHYVGLQAVARKMHIEELWSVHEIADTKGPYEQWLDDLRASGTIVSAPPVGVARQSGIASLHVLWPVYSEDAENGEPRRSQGDPILSVNDNSLVVRLEVGGRNVLFAGDIEAEAEKLLVSRYGAWLQSDIVKVPHHGSRTSSTESFVHALQPEVAVISCGRANRFGFPAVEVEERWKHYGGVVVRTDKVGSVTVEIDNAGRMNVYTVESF